MTGHDRVHHDQARIIEDVVTGHDRSCLLMTRHDWSYTGHQPSTDPDVSTELLHTARRIQVERQAQRKATYYVCCASCV